uniref:Actin n=1 Tax=Solanum tuberosum TaxID=4113 RepID=M1BVH7_SOLTU
MFEKFSVPSMYVAIQSVLSQFAYGRLTGLGGRDITDYFTRILSEGGYVFHGTIREHATRHMKETISYVALDFEKEIEKAKNRSSVEKAFVLPSGKVLNIGAERFHCPEVLFQP